MMELKDIHPKIIDHLTAQSFISKYHYTRCCPQGIIIAIGHYYNDTMINCIVFANPVGRCMASGLLEGGNQTNTLELVRMVSLEPKPKNLESYCISNSLKIIKKVLPQYKVVISYADNSMGHTGYVYQASNFYYYGQSRVTDEWYLDGKRMHERTFFANYGTSSKVKLKEMLGDRFKVVEQPLTKSRYFILLPQNKKEKKELLKRVKVKILPYPKLENKRYDIKTNSFAGKTNTVDTRKKLF